MRAKWNKSSDPNIGNGHPISQKLPLGETTFRPKLLQHTPSIRAMRTYNDLRVDGNFQRDIDISMYETDNGNRRYEENDIYSNVADIEGSKDSYQYDYPTMSVRTNTTNYSGSELNSDINDTMGSTVKLIPTQMEMSCTTWCSYLSTTVCTISMALGIGNLYRLPQTTIVRGGLPFLVVYIVLTVLIGLPLLFLELGIGQLAQEGFIKSWRAVPFFRGIGYVKLLAGCLLSIYYPLYMALAVYYIIWILKGPLPFQECSASRVKITEKGYSTYGTGKEGQQCLRETFLKSPFDDPYWFGIYAAILLVIWIFITLLSIRRTKSYIRSLMILLFPALACYVTLMVKSILLEEEFDSLDPFISNYDWSILANADVWYFATIQVFFSTNVGFGPFITNAGIIYNKVNPFWTAFGYIVINILFGTGSIIISQSLTGKLNVTANKGDVAELYLVALIYDIGKNSDNEDVKSWTILAYLIIILAGFINMATLTYTLLKAITGQNGGRLKWWQTSIILSFTGFFLGCAVLLQSNFDIVHLLDHYIVGNLILITVIIEVFALIVFYGTERIKSDFEFMLGHILSKFWLITWAVLPLLLTAIFAWGMTTLPLEGIYRDDPAWLYGIGWGVVLCATFFIFAIGCYIVTRQDGYTINDQIRASLKPCNKWGPKDPMSRHTWIQWNSKAQHGERDFTLKRKGTRDYTRSIKKNAKRAAGDDLSSTSVQGTYYKNKLDTPRISNESNNYDEIYSIQGDTNSTLTRPRENYYNRPLRVTSLIDSFDSDAYAYQPSHNSLPNGELRTNKNPLAQPTLYIGDLQDGSEGYGTFRKGPYLINDDNVDHVCFRRTSGNEDVTEL